MNKLKRFFITAVALLLSLVCVFGLTACGEDIDEVNVGISMYNFEDGEMQDYSFEIELYRHLAPKTVDAISKYLKDGYYNGAVFYKYKDYKNQIMVGDLKYDPNLSTNEGFYLDKKPNIEGEFKYGGTIGSNLKNQKGSIGLWRTWAAQDLSFNQGSTGMDTGSATWFIPNYPMGTYDDYFCVFAQYDVEDAENKEMLDDLNKIFEDSNYQSYVIYYTGEYLTNGEGLTFHCVKADKFNKDNIENLFVAEENSSQYVCYNHYEIQVPMTSDGTIAAQITSASVK